MNPGNDGDGRRSVEINARTVDEAVARGLVRLGGLSRSEVKIEILEEPKAGLLGFGSSEALVRLTTLKPGERPEDVPSGGPGRQATPKPPQQVPEREERGSESQDLGSQRQVPGRQRREADSPARPEPSWERRDTSADRQDIQTGRWDTGPEDEPAGRPEPARPQAPLATKPEYRGGRGQDVGDVVSPDDAEAAALEVTGRLLEGLGYQDTKLERSGEWLPDELSDDRSLVLGINGTDVGRLLQNDGEGLQALQFLARLILARKANGWVNLLLDVEGDRARRVRELVELAKQSADLVQREGRPVSLPPMSPYERRVVHIVLKDHPVVATQSIGAGEFRKVTVRRMDQLLPEL